MLQLPRILAARAQENEEPELRVRARRQLRHHGRQPAEVQKVPIHDLPAGRNDGKRHPDGGAEEDAVPENDSETRGDDEPAECHQR